MDDLGVMHLRLNELIEGKVERRAALEQEIKEIDKELASARQLLGLWPEMKKTRRKPETKAPEVPKVKEPEPMVMPLAAVLEFLRGAGPQDKGRILSHFCGGAKVDGRQGRVLDYWVKEGSLEQHADGRFAAPALKLATAG
jgi:hypothetical protein